MNSAKGHLIRWLLIIAMGLFIFLGTFTFHPWSAESAIKEQLRGMDLPGEVEAVSILRAGKMNSVLFWDEEHQLYHHSWMKHTLGMLWTPRGGGFGYTLQEKEWRIKFGEGYSNLSNRSYYYVIGQVNDPDVAMIEILWKDGTSEKKEPDLGRLIHFAREGRAGDALQQSLGLRAYDAGGSLLYELDHDNNAIPADDRRSANTQVEP